MVAVVVGADPALVVPGAADPELVAVVEPPAPVVDPAVEPPEPVDAAAVVGVAAVVVGATVVAVDFELLPQAASTSDPRTIGATTCHRRMPRRFGCEGGRLFTERQSSESRPVRSSLVAASNCHPKADPIGRQSLRPVRIIVDMVTASLALPVLDIAAFREDPTSADALAFVAELRRVVHEIGFFYVSGHGVDVSVADRVHRVARQFFAEPEDVRLEIENVRSAQFRGYTRFGHEHTNGKADLRDQVDVGRELPPPALGPNDPAWLVLRGPNLWPTSPAEFRPVVAEWMTELEAVAHTMLHALALALGQPADVFDELVDPAEILLKVIRYRAATGAEEASDQGVGAHRDTGFITFVHQDDIGGLQVERDGQLVDVPALPETLVVNIGEMFQLVTRGYFKATVHRVVAPPAGRERISVAYFFNPKLEATLAPIDLPPELAAHAPGGESADPGNPILANYGDNSLKVRLRAHPDVAAVHHAELLASGRWSSQPTGSSR